MNELGNINISAEVVSTIAHSVINDIDGVYSLANDTTKNEITKFFKNVTSSSKNRGIEVEIGETECIVDVYIIAKLGTKLPALAADIQNRVIKAITEMTGLKVQEVNVYIQKVMKAEEKNDDEVLVIEEDIEGK